MIREDQAAASVVSLEDERARMRAEALRRDHGEYLHGLARRLCRSNLDPDDLLQDVFEKTVRSPASIPDGANERAWLSRVMHNLFIDKLRRKHARREEPMTSDVAAQRDDETAWWEALTADEVRVQVAKLPEDQRATFELFAFEGKSYDEIAAALRIAKGTVGSRILRARTRLKELLTKECADG
jgi:RNA polymerase sigma-70 factor, ECF subfamily